MRHMNNPQNASDTLSILGAPVVGSELAVVLLLTIISSSLASVLTCLAPAARSMLLVKRLKVFRATGGAYTSVHATAWTWSPMKEGLPEIVDALDQGRSDPTRGRCSRSTLKLLLCHQASRRRPIRNWCPDRTAERLPTADPAASAPSFTGRDGPRVALNCSYIGGA